MHNMKLNKKAILSVLLIVTVLLAAGCAATKNPYRTNDAEG